MLDLMTFCFTLLPVITREIIHHVFTSSGRNYNYTTLFFPGIFQYSALKHDYVAVSALVVKVVFYSHYLQSKLVHLNETQEILSQIVYKCNQKIYHDICHIQNISMTFRQKNLEMAYFLCVIRTNLRQKNYFNHNKVVIFYVNYYIQVEFQPMVFSQINIILFLVLGGFFLPMLYGFSFCVSIGSIVLLPFAIGNLKLLVFSLWPDEERLKKTNPTINDLTIFEILWIIFGGFESALMHCIIAVFFAITIIGIPFAHIHLRFARLALFPRFFNPPKNLRFLFTWDPLEWGRKESKKKSKKHHRARRYSDSDSDYCYSSSSTPTPTYHHRHRKHSHKRKHYDYTSESSA
ncbi:hypothetical protein TRFO_35815 [Tritrichomonas foetus]|uniref:Inner membrane component domain-containing protein n=1 Tax=Tritrichomonas foetus TaxID=1144522 RepID=A0A1J4JFG0_9EUKA|nr:hypothetical protein TRFO_35815 [Tritrichomonas foetus]|eukprot:OHS97882.1 hypothetical protein TRFO_35815 [Tritrichomonas foetus]